MANQDRLTAARQQRLVSNFATYSEDVPDDAFSHAMRLQKDYKVGRTRRVAAARARMPLTLITCRNPLIHQVPENTTIWDADGGDHAVAHGSIINIQSVFRAQREGTEVQSEFSMAVTELVQDDEPNDSIAITNYIWDEIRKAGYEESKNHGLIKRANYLGHQPNRGGEQTIHFYPCAFSRSSSTARISGGEPKDEPHNTLSVVIPGGCSREVKITDIGMILEEQERRIYTIINIQTDWLRYISRLTIEEFGHRSAPIAGGL